MSSIATHLVRRGLEATRDHYQSTGNDVTTFQIPVWGFVILWISGFAYLLLLGAVCLSSYSLFDKSGYTDKTTRLTIHTVQL